MLKNCDFHNNSLTPDEVEEIYSKGCREGPSKVLRIAEITKFRKTAIFVLSQDHQLNRRNSVMAHREGPAKGMRIAKTTLRDYALKTIFPGCCQQTTVKGASANR